MKSTHHALLIGASLAVASPVLPQTSPATLPTTRATALTSPIRLDGKLDEDAWASAQPTTQFTQINPEEGTPGSERTEVRVLFDSDALYIGVRAFDRGPVTARLGRRDMSLGDSDWIGVMIDSYHDHRTAFGFDVNPAGVQRDEIKTINSDDNSWDAVWAVATSIDSAGWVAEYRIPFSQLRFKPGTDQTWGVQFERVIGRRNEYMVSTFIPKKETGGVPAYGHLEGITELRPGARLELLPYTLARAEFVERGQNPFRDRHEYGNAVGLDLRYRVASNLTLNATINPDFGQVEVDPAIVNLGVYETFFDEKRPFFLEGSEIFNFGLGNTSGGRLFYSRRIGRPPSLFAPSPRFDAPVTTTILGAAKLSGKVKGWSIGSLAALTGREEARYLDAANTELNSPVEPRSGYFVSRARRELRGGQSLVGGVLTLVHRDLADSVLTASFRSDALTAGVDFLHQWNRRSWSLRGDAEMSRVGGSIPSIVAVQRAGHHYFQRPDAGHLGVDSATSLVGYSTSANLAKQAGLHWRGELAGALTSPGYEVNDLGFAQRTDRRDIQLAVTYQETKPGKMLRSWSTNYNIRSEHNYANEPILTVARFTGTASTLGYFTIHGNLAEQFRSYDDRLTRGGPIAIRPAVHSAFLFLSTDGRKPVTGDWQVNLSKGEVEGAWSASTALGVGIKTSSRWNLRVGPRFSRAGTPAQFVTRVTDAAYTPTYGVRYVFAPISQTELGLETRFNYTFTPHLTLESYVQPLISSGDYGDARQLRAARTFDFVPYTGTIPNLDFNLRSLRGNAVVRWEWRPGSTLFVAWQQSRRNVGGIGDFEFNRDQGALFAARPDNIFLVKMNWWLAR